MKSDQAREIVRRAVEQTARQERGLHRRIVGLGPRRMLEGQIEDTTRLPSIERTQELQNAAGQFYFIVGYSAVGGPDVVA